VNVQCDVCGRAQEGDWIWVGNGMHFRPGVGVRLTGDYCSVGCLQAAIDRLHGDKGHDNAPGKRSRRGEAGEHKQEAERRNLQLPS
jgi:hypothetical protein